MTANHYLIALGSNQPHPRYGSPRRVLAKAASVICGELGVVLALAPVIATAPIGPSQRSYANGALVLESDLKPTELLDALLGIEARFGRVRRGERWRARVLDLDIVLWSGGIVATQRLQIPHPRFSTRAFVTGPAAAIAPFWRDPVSGLTLSQLHARLTRPRPMPR